MYFSLSPVGTDYAKFPGPPSGVLTLLFPAGTKNGAVKNVPLIILNDYIVEGKETVVLMAFVCHYFVGYNYSDHVGYGDLDHYVGYGDLDHYVGYGDFDRYVRYGDFDHYTGSGDFAGSGDFRKFIYLHGVKASFAPGQDRVTVYIWDNDGKYSVSPLVPPGLVPRVALV